MVEAKILFQDVCKEKTNWDDELPEPYQEKWLQWSKDLRDTKEVEVKRCMFNQREEEVKEINLHGVCDASEKAYCCAIYLHIVTEKDQQVTLLTSQTRMTPLKAMSIPRLELTAARTLAQLLETVQEALGGEVELTSINLWTGSMTTLWWIRNKKEWKQYVTNRANKILERTEIANWRHCPRIQNPADIGSRGMKSAELKEKDLWWNEPEWIGDRNSWPKSEEVEETEASVKEQKKESFQALVTREKQNNNQIC